MMKNRDFGALILTHGRPNKVITYNTLRKCGYTGKIFIVIDNEVKAAQEYRDLYSDEVVIFDKKAIAQTFDEADNFEDRRAIVYARNASFEIAKKLGLKYFIQLDDDYETFGFKFDENYNFQERRINSLDKVFDILIDFQKSVPNLKSVAFAQNGDFIGGALGTNAHIHLGRKCMNSFICSTDEDRQFRFVGRINEDVNTYTHLASKGLLLFTVFQISLNQKTTQSNSGGMTDIYMDNGTYVKSFYSVIFQPSSVKVGMMGDKYKRLHHSVNWNCTVPKIINEKYKKK